MAAYAALVSLMQTIDEIKNHPRPPISLHKKQVDSLTDNVVFLQDFLEGYSSGRGSKEEEELESRICRAAYAAEDVIETHIVDQIHPSSTSRLHFFGHLHRVIQRIAQLNIGCLDLYQGLERVIQRIADLFHGENIGCVDLYQGLERVIEDMDLIKKEVMEIIKEKMMGSQHHQLMSTNSSVRPASTWQNSTMVGFEDVLIEALDKLTDGNQNLDTISIFGMGGMGKTTLARNIYEHPLIVQRFYILVWVTISQEYTVPHILSQVLFGGNKRDQIGEAHEIGVRVHKKLWGRWYLIVIDDIWSIEAWYKIGRFFPDNGNGSRILITTRFTNLALKLSGYRSIQMKFLNKDKSWDLLCEVVFGKGGSCPIELGSIGKKIAKKCKGLPLTIVVIGGLLKISERTEEYWNNTLKNLNSLINLEDGEHCLQVLHSSYTVLPVHLKPCFLYMGVFPEDSKISVSGLIKLWVAEGFLKPVAHKSLEEVAEKYMKELIDRNLILIHELSWNGKAKRCKIHDLVRDLSLREAEKQRFLCILREQDLNFPEGIKMERRICIHENTPVKYSPQFLHALESASRTRSLLQMRGFHDPSASFGSKLLRVYSWACKHYSSVRDATSIEAIFQQANLRCLSIEFDFHPSARFPSSWSLLWNLQTLKVVTPIASKPIIAPSEIWEMSQLRHVIFNGLQLPDPPSGDDICVLSNLQTLSTIWNLKCSEEVVKRIPNIKKLKLSYDRVRLEEEGVANFCLHNLRNLVSLESLCLYLSSDAISDPEILQSDLVHDLAFPSSLKKLTLHGTALYWDDMTKKVGLLPDLQVLKLESGSCRGDRWETEEGDFCSLRFLLIDGWRADLKYWITDDDHFPLLEHLVLQNLVFLKEIPSTIGDISTLESIQLVSCSDSATCSAREIQEEQLKFGNDLKLQIDIRRRNTGFLG